MNVVLRAVDEEEMAQLAAHRSLFEHAVKFLWWSSNLGGLRGAASLLVLLLHTAPNAACGQRSELLFGHLVVSNSSPGAKLQAPNAQPRDRAASPSLGERPSKLACLEETAS